VKVITKRSQNFGNFMFLDKFNDYENILEVLNELKGTFHRKFKNCGETVPVPKYHTVKACTKLHIFLTPALGHHVSLDRVPSTLIR
jgi:hypothetical protein